MGIVIRVIKEHEEFQETVSLQREVWGFSETDIVPTRLMTVSTHIGGLVLGAYDGEEMIGFSLALPGVKPGGKAYWHSHMTGLAPAFQGQGIGRRIKFRQREEAQRAGIDLIEWTFDPLEIRNSYFNLERLGVVVRSYVPNQYGITSSRLHGGLPTDRLMAEWWLRTPRVENAVGGGQLPRASKAERIRILANIGELKKSDAKAAAEAQSEAGAQFEKWFGQGYAVTGFELDDEFGTYLLESFESRPE